MCVRVGGGRGEGWVNGAHRRQSPYRADASKSRDAKVGRRRHRRRVLEVRDELLLLLLVLVLLR